MLNLVWILIQFHYTVGIYQIFTERKTWEDSQNFCKLGNGKLAHLYSISLLPESWKGSNMGFWVGGVLRGQGFNWITKDKGNDAVIPLEPLVHRRGCFRPAQIYGGYPLKELSSEKCFNQCHWKGTIGLKSHYCMCEENLRQITRTLDLHCDSKCSGNPVELCGGPKGVSMYNLNQKSVLWGNREPDIKYECVYVRKLSHNNQLLWYTASCRMRMRYICHFEDHEACGVRKSCFRASVQPDTWQGIRKGCRLLNGTTAIVDITMMYSEDTGQLPPGEYWIGLRRQRRWEWINGLPISTSLFHGSTKTSLSNRKCAALTTENNSLGLTATSCTEKKPFICQFDIRNNFKATTTLNKTNIESTTKYFLRSQNKEPQEISDDKVILKRKSRNATYPTDKNNTDEDESNYIDNLYKSIMYLAIGVAAGLGFVLSICVIVYVGKRCRSRTTEFKTVRYPKGRENPVLRYASDSPSNQGTSEPEVLYEIPCDAQESPFRKTQRILQQNYAIGRDGFPSNSWRRKKSDRENGSQARNRQPEIRTIHPYSERSYGDTSYIIHNVRAQCHPNSNQQGTPVDITYTGSLDTRLRRPPSQTQQNSDVRLSDTYSLPEQGRKLSEPVLHVDTSDLYACVQKVMDNPDDDYYDNSDHNVRVTVC